MLSCSSLVKNDIQKKGSNVALLYKPDDNNLVVEADKERITQVISNLLSNAIKFTKEGSISIKVMENAKHNSHQQEEEEVMVSIKDTGTGIDSEILPRLFTKFATNLIWLVVLAWDYLFQKVS